jgi:hybrid polyketide synthase/nonribosomal peptide synthetase ACE1
MIRSALTNWTDAQQINDPVCSQTLCTAVQILLVDLLLASKIRFTAVVGHSSGEIAASYAAGYLSAEDCIQIAYYRGLHVSRGQGTSNKKGAMIAVGMPLNLASSICEQERFAGRLAVAAWNSVSSVTLSGDEDAVSDVQDICHKDKRFARRLRVGTAYHSHHMTGLTGPYMESMENCEIEVRNAPSSPDRPIWFSSVGKDGTRVRPDRRLKSHYWVDNMRGTVCFYPALVRAVDECGPFNLVVEIGPHPALKGPVLDVLKEAGNSSVPYVSPFMRDQNDCQAFALAIGSIWTRSGPTNISLPDLADFVNRGNPRASCIPLKGLPGYAWDHELSIWTESRMAHRIRMDKTPRHSLLGLRTVEGPEDEWRWQNILRPKELPWILDHRIQGRAVFPATGYILQAVEAIRQLANGLSVQHIEIRDLKIMHTAMIDDSWGLETFVILSNIEDHDGILTASFTTYAASVQKAQKLERCATCAVEIALKSLDELPSLQTRERGGDSPLIEVDIPLFRSTLQTVGYGYHGAFQGLSDLRRRTNYAEASIASQALSPPDNGWLFHPATLDNAIQSIFAAYSAPGDGVLRELHVPTRIGHLKLSLGAFEGAINGGSYVASQVTEVGSNRITADVNIFDRDGDGISSIRDVELLPVGSQQSSVQDCEMIFETALTVECPNGPLAVKNLNLQQESCHQKAVDCQRVAFYYVRLLHELFPPATRMGTQLPPHHKALLDFCSHIVEQAHKKAHPYIQSEWFADSQPTIDALVAR